MRGPLAPWLAAGLSWLAILSVPAAAQGTFANFETPQTHPIELFQLGAREYVAVCNTPNNTLEIYRTAAQVQHQATIPVGLGPSSVRFNPVNERLYVTNFDGDSISMIDVALDGTDLVAILERTTSRGPTSLIRIGDEPSDIAFGMADHEGQVVPTAFVTISGRSEYQRLDPTTLEPLGAPEAFVVDVNNQFDVVHSPRYVEWMDSDRLLVANMRNSMRDIPSGAGSLLLDYDIGITERTGPALAPGPAVRGLGTAIHAFEITSDGKTLFAVGVRAQNQAASGEAAISALPTGFVQSWMWVIDLEDAGGQPILELHDPAEMSGSGFTTPLLPSINLNQDYDESTLSPVETDLAVVQPTGIALIEDRTGAVTHIIIAGFHSDRIMILQPNNQVARGYDAQHLTVTVDPNSQYSMVGPRGVVYSPRTRRAFINGRLDNSLIVIDPFNPVTSASDFMQKTLPFDPTSDEIRRGRKFLYSSRFSIDNSSPNNLRGGFVSCASCHIDGRTDGLAWDLESPNFDFTDPLNADLLDPNTEGFTPTFFSENFAHPTEPGAYAFPTDKGPIVTQTLQGLVNYELNSEYQHVATNAPYYWRGARGDFTDFNKAFVNLQGMDDMLEIPPAEPQVNGITPAQMEVYRTFVNTIRHPPNPEQDLERLTTGDLGSDDNDPAEGSGALRGMKLFHNLAVIGERACVDCHSLPEGSSNTLTLPLPVPYGLIYDPLVEGNFQFHPFESAALRNIASRERIKHIDFEVTDTSDFIKSFEGLFHSGDPDDTPGFDQDSAWSINNFVHQNDAFTALGSIVDGVGTPAPGEEAVTEFIRQFDTGSAPAEGFSFTFDPAPGSITNDWIDLLEMQVEEANIGLAVITRNNGTELGYWYDISDPDPNVQGVYMPEGSGTSLTTAEIKALASGWPGSGNLVVFQATPLGSDRHVASLGVGAGTTHGGGAPNGVLIQPMAPDTAYVDVAKFSENLNYDPNNAPGFSLPDPRSSIWTQRVLQHAVATSVGGFGVREDLPEPSVHHEPPRRFRVTGNNIRPGARMVLYMAETQAASNAFETLEMDLYPTRYQAGGKRIWETRVELDATQTFALLCGGYEAPSVQEVLSRSYDPATATAEALTGAAQLDPDTWNWFQVRIINEGGGLMNSPSAWQRLTVQDHRGNP